MTFYRSDNPFNKLHLFSLPVLTNELPFYQEPIYQPMGTHLSAIGCEQFEKGRGDDDDLSAEKNNNIWD
jgi:hypothetical protein